MLFASQFSVSQYTLLQISVQGINVLRQVENKSAKERRNNMQTYIHT